MIRLFFYLLCLFFWSATSTAQTLLSPATFFSAEWFDRFEGAARISELKKLESNNWFAIDTIYESGEQFGKGKFQTVGHNMAPYIDSDGFVVHLVPEEAPKFPGGKKALLQYLRESLGPYTAWPKDEVQQSVFVRFVIDVDGSTVQVEEAQAHSEWILRDVITQCIDAVRFMPRWQPGAYRGKPVRVAKMLSFSLK